MDLLPCGMGAYQVRVRRLPPVWQASHDVPRVRAQVLNKARDDAGKLAQASLRDTNNVVRMVTAGSKGSFINISQVRVLAIGSAVFCRMLTLEECDGVLILGGWPQQTVGRVCQP